MQTPVFRAGVIILAAGSSSRMGTPKQLLPLGGEPMLLRVVDAALNSAAWPIVVVLGANAERIRPLLSRYPLLIAENPAWIEGMASSIRTGITTLRQFSRAVDAAVVALCDQPNFTTDVIQRLVETHQTTGRSIVASRYEGRNGAPALFHHQHFTTLANLTGEEGARALLNSNPDDVAAIDLPELAADLDTPADYAAFQQTLTHQKSPYP